MEILVSFLLALNVFTYDPKTTTKDDVYKACIVNNDLLIETYGDEYTRIIGTDETEE